MCDEGGVLSRAAARLEVDAPSLAEALCTRRIFLPTGDAYIKPLDEVQAADGSSALAKAVYGRMFDAIVAKLNGLISCESRAVAPKAFIGILDIFGFESFTVNSFEQLYLQRGLTDQYTAQSAAYTAADPVPFQSAGASTLPTRCCSSSSMRTCSINNKKSMRLRASPGRTSRIKTTGQFSSSFEGGATVSLLFLMRNAGCSRARPALSSPSSPTPMAR